jgi:hypothetical protein
MPTADTDSASGLEKTNAVLFYQLARFLVWSQQHRTSIGPNRELEDLIQDAATVLADTGPQRECLAIPRCQILSSQSKVRPVQPVGRLPEV